MGLGTSLAAASPALADPVLNDLSVDRDRLGRGIDKRTPSFLGG